MSYLKTTIFNSTEISVASCICSRAMATSWWSAAGAGGAEGQIFAGAKIQGRAYLTPGAGVRANAGFAQGPTLPADRLSRSRVAALAILTRSVLASAWLRSACGFRCPP